MKNQFVDNVKINLPWKALVDLYKLDTEKYPLSEV